MSRKYTSEIRGLKTVLFFGKTPKNMNYKERKEYNKIKKAESRRKPEIYWKEREWQKKYYYQNLEKYREKRKKYYEENKEMILLKNKVKNPFGHCISRKMFGCALKEMSKEKMNQYKDYLRKRNKFKNIKENLFK